MPDEPPDLCCPTCGYSLRGLTESRCPECGEPFDVLLLTEALRDDLPGTLPWDSGTAPPALRQYRQTWSLVVFSPTDFGRRLSPAPNLDRAYEFATSSYLVGSTAAGLWCMLVIILRWLAQPDPQAVTLLPVAACCPWIVVLFGTWMAGAFFQGLLVRILHRRLRPQNVVDARRFWAACAAYASGHFLIAAAGGAIALTGGLLDPIGTRPWTGSALGVAGAVVIVAGLVAHAWGFGRIVAARAPAEPRAAWIGVSSWLLAAAIMLAAPMVIVFGVLVLISVF